MPEDRPNLQDSEASKPAETSENEINFSDIDALRQDVKKEHRASRLHGFFAALCGAAALGGIYFLSKGYITGEGPKNPNYTLMAEMAVTVGFVTQGNAAIKRGERAKKLDDALFGVLERSHVATYSTDPQFDIAPAADSYSLDGHETARNIVITAVHLKEILGSQGVSLESLQHIAPTNTSPSPSEQIALPPESGQDVPPAAN